MNNQEKTTATIEYTNVDAQTVARILRRDQEQKNRKPDTSVRGYATRQAGFSLMK